MTSPRPPLSLGGLHSKVTEVSFRVEIGFSAADGGPGSEIKERTECYYNLLSLFVNPVCVCTV